MGKLNFFENVIKEYQKKCYIPKYTNIFDTNYKIKNKANIQRLYSNMKVFQKIKEDNSNFTNENFHKTKSENNFYRSKIFY